MTQASPSRPATPYGIPAVELAFALGAFALGISEFAAMGLLPRIADDVGVSVPDGGLSIAAYAVGVVVGAPLLTLSLTRAPRRPLLVGFALLIALGNLLTSLAQGFPLLVVARFIAGLPHGAYLGTAATVVAALVPANKRGSAVARVILGLSVANLVGVPLATWLGQAMGWRVVFGLVTVLAIVTALLVRVTLPVIGAGKPVGLRGEVRAIMRPQVLLALGIAAVGFGGMFAIYSYITPTLMEVTHLPEAVVPVMMVLFGLGMVVGSMLGGWLADRGVMRAVGIMLGASAVAQLLFLVTPYNPWAVAVNIFLVGATSMGLSPALQTRLMDAAPDAQMLAASLNHSAFNLANALGAWLGGVVIALHFGWTSTGALGALLTMGGLAVFFVALMQDRAQTATAGD